MFVLISWLSLCDRDPPASQRLPRASELQGFHKPGWSPWWSCWHPSGCQRTTSLSSSQWIGHCKWQIQTNLTRAKQKQNEPSSSSVSFFSFVQEKSSRNNSHLCSPPGRDRFRTMVNVMGDALATGIMAHICRKDFMKEGDGVSFKCVFFSVESN